MYSVRSYVMFDYCCVFVCTAFAVMLCVAICFFCVCSVCNNVMFDYCCVIVCTACAEMLCVAIDVFLCAQRVHYCYE